MSITLHKRFSFLAAGVLLVGVLVASSTVPVAAAPVSSVNYDASMISNLMRDMMKTSSSVGYNQQGVMYSNKAVNYEANNSSTASSYEMAKGQQASANTGTNYAMTGLDYNTNKENYASKNNQANNQFANAANNGITYASDTAQTPRDSWYGPWMPASSVDYSNKGSTSATGSSSTVMQSVDYGKDGVGLKQTGVNYANTTAMNQSSYETAKGQQATNNSSVKYSTNEVNYATINTTYANTATSDMNKLAESLKNSVMYSASTPTWNNHDWDVEQGHSTNWSAPTMMQITLPPAPANSSQVFFSSSEL